MASTSSKKTMHAFLLRAIWKSSRTMRAPSPTYFCTSSLPMTRMKQASVRFATARADSVLPVPGGPYRRKRHPPPFSSTTSRKRYRGGGPPPRWVDDAMARSISLVRAGSTSWSHASTLLSHSSSPSTSTKPHCLSVREKATAVGQQWRASEGGRRFQARSPHAATRSRRSLSESLPLSARCTLRSFLVSFAIASPTSSAADAGACPSSRPLLVSTTSLPGAACLSPLEAPPKVRDDSFGKKHPARYLKYEWPSPERPCRVAARLWRSLRRSASPSRRTRKGRRDCSRPPVCSSKMTSKRTPTNSPAMATTHSRTSLKLYFLPPSRDLMGS
mmetsp:Transcript_3127/g.7936  ORF Transcript_3127/g.7936 Transcript_3127/m.7936 type:complete len:331 (-) Transcript_3127:88-1080(-)